MAFTTRHRALVLSIALLFVWTGYLRADGSAQAVSSEEGSAVQPVRHKSGDTPKAIPEFGAVDSTLTITRSLKIADLDVRLQIDHPWTEDLVVTLTSPSGTRVVLLDAVGGSRDDFRNTVLDDEASTGIRLGTAPFTGAFVPESPLAAFDSENARGTWRLTVDDVIAGDSGTLIDWTLLITPASGALSKAVFIDFAHSGKELGTRDWPFRSLKSAIAHRSDAETFVIQPGSTDERIRIDTPVVFECSGAGTVRIGASDASAAPVHSRRRAAGVPAAP